MIDVMTTEGVFLDLEPGYEFSLEMENPLFGSDSVCSAFSTQITFPPSETNRRVFGYAEAMMLPPQRKETACRLFLNGIPMMDGKLVYEGIEDGNLEYTFTALSVDDRFRQKISDVKIACGGAYPSVEGVLADLRADRLDGVHGPVIIDQAFTEQYNGRDYVQDKIINYPHDIYGRRRTMPAIDVLRILRPGLSLIRINPALQGKLSGLVILGQYVLSADKESDAVFSRMGGEYDFAKFLPGITFIDLMNLICSIYAAKIYQDGSSMVMVEADAVLNGPVKDIDMKISDTYSSGIEFGKGYSIGFGSGAKDTYNIANLDADIEDGDMQESTVSWSDMLRNSPATGSTQEYRSIIHRGSGQCYSYKMSGGEILIDAIYQGHDTFSTGEAENMEAVQIQGTPVKCVPYVVPVPVYNAYGSGDVVTYDSNVTRVNDHRIVPIVTVPDKAERGTDVLLGIYTHGQVVDLGLFIDPSDTADNIVENGLSLAPEALFAAHHQRLAEWLSKDRQVVTAGLDLNVQDIASWRLFHRFAFRGRMWLCRKLTVSFLAGSDAIEAEGEFVEL